MADYAQMNQYLYEGNAKEVEQRTKDALAEGRPVQEVLTHGLIAGMSVVGEDFKHNVLYVPEVLIAARAMKAGMAVLRPLLSAKSNTVKPVGVLLMGTVRGDLHDIGKNLVSMMAEGAGFEVHDIGGGSKRREIQGRRRKMQAHHHRHERSSHYHHDVYEAAEFIEEHGGNVVALNCGTGMDMERARQAVLRYRQVTDLPVMVQPNAGQPKLVDLKVVYDEAPEQMAQGVAPLLQAGASVIGACCGSAPEHIRAFRQAMDEYLKHENQAL